MMIRYPVDGRRGDVHKTLYAMPKRSIEYVAGALDVCGVDILRRVERQGRRRVDDEISSLHRPVNHRFVPDIAPDDLDAVALRIIEVLHIERGHGVAPGEEMPCEVDPQKSGPTRNKNSLLVHKSKSPCDYS